MSHWPYTMLLGLFILISILSTECKYQYNKSKRNIDILTHSTLNFTEAVYDACRWEEGNLFLSPFSLQVTLAMLYNGAKGKTAQEIQDAAFFPQDKNTINKGIKSLIKSLKGGDNKVVIEVANAIFLSDQVTLRSSYKEAMVLYYSAELPKTDFRHPKKAADTIDTWVAQKTHDTINNLFKPDKFSPDTMAVLVNAMYFKAFWKHKFDKTVEGKFYLDNGYTKKIPFLVTKGIFKLSRCVTLDTHVVEIPYDSKYSMYLLIPLERGNLGHAEDNLKDTDLVKELSKGNPTEIVLKIPKFKIEEEYDLKPLLKFLNMKAMFRRSADFSAMASMKLALDEAIQKTFIEVNEKGTEAAAVTSGGMIPPSSPPTIRADHPFMFIIATQKDQFPVFIGRFSVPGT